MLLVVGVVIHIQRLIHALYYVYVFLAVKEDCLHEKIVSK